MSIPRELYEIASMMQIESIANGDGIVVVADESENEQLRHVRVIGSLTPSEIRRYLGLYRN